MQPVLDPHQRVLNEALQERRRHSGHWHDRLRLDRLQYQREIANGSAGSSLPARWRCAVAEHLRLDVPNLHL